MTWRLMAVVVLLATVVIGPADADSVTAPDTINVLGETSIVLDSSGNPVIAYRGNSDLRVLVCDDPDCTPLEFPIVPDLPGSVGEYTSIVLDAAGKPVVAYHDATNGALKIIHCNDPFCNIGGDSITTPDPGGNAGADVVGTHTSIALDGAGFPVVSYYDETNEDLRVMHCNDVNCAGGNESIEIVDATGNVGIYSDLELDALGNPVVSYTDLAAGELKLVHCNDPDCSRGGNESIVVVDDDGVTGWHTSLELDSLGFPVIAYLRITGQDVRVAHCNDANCTGGDESLTAPETIPNVGFHMTMDLDSAGFPVLAYYESTNDDLKIMRCNDANCAGNDEAIVIADSAGDVGQDASLVLDANGYPVVSYHDATSGDDSVFGGDGNDRIELGAGNDSALGQDGADIILGGTGNDMISGNAGNDTLLGENNQDTIFGGSGDDTINGGEDNDTLGGGSDSDSVSGNNGDDLISSGSGSDSLASGGKGEDRVNGGGGNDDNVHGDEGNDFVSGNGGVDVVDGDDGNDTVRGGQNDDLVRGGEGNDFVAGNEGTDICDGGPETIVDQAAPNCETLIDIP
ncbi:MAG: calcium-binding protein [Actinomycetota bacterium]